MPLSSTLAVTILPKHTVEHPAAATVSTGEAIAAIETECGGVATRTNCRGRRLMWGFNKGKGGPFKVHARASEMEYFPTLLVAAKLTPK